LHLLARQIVKRLKANTHRRWWSGRTVCQLAEVGNKKALVLVTLAVDHKRFADAVSDTTMLMEDTMPAA
jgi:hypothetical protein